jgi:hypothetical protein
MVFRREELQSSIVDLNFDSCSLLWILWAAVLIISVSVALVLHQCVLMKYCGMRIWLWSSFCTGGKRDTHLFLSGSKCVIRIRQPEVWLWRCVVRLLCVGTCAETSFCVLENGQVHVFWQGVTFQLAVDSHYVCSVWKDNINLECENLPSRQEEAGEWKFWAWSN